MVDVKTWKNAVNCTRVASLVLIGLVAIIILRPDQNNGNSIVSEETLVLNKSKQIVGKSGPIPGCNLFSGKWVYDNVSYPLYKEGECSLMGDKFTACGKYGRKEFKYQNWRWQPHHCNIPRFDGRALLEKIRGKKLLFVGDSLSRNQWESMLCLIESCLPSSSDKSRKLQLKTKGNMFKYHFIEYDVTIGFYWAPLLVESNCDDPENHRGIKSRTVRIKSIEKHGRHWIDADFLVFDSFAWWTDEKMTILWGSFDNPNSIYKEVGMTLRRYEIALNTWSDWLELHINQSKTKMFLMSQSPVHFGVSKRREYHCHNQTEPILDGTYWTSTEYRNLMQVAESTIEKLEKKGVKVEYLNITQLSGYRKDGHPSIYRNSSFVTIYFDCLHWCLPGVPDVWNQILYTYIMKS